MSIITPSSVISSLEKLMSQSPSPNWSRLSFVHVVPHDLSTSQAMDMMDKLTMLGETLKQLHQRALLDPQWIAPLLWTQQCYWKQLTDDYLKKLLIDIDSHAKLITMSWEDPHLLHPLMSQAWGIWKHKDLLMMFEVFIMIVNKKTKKDLELLNCFVNWVNDQDPSKVPLQKNDQLHQFLSSMLVTLQQDHIPTPLALSTRQKILQSPWFQSTQAILSSPTLLNEIVTWPLPLAVAIINSNLKTVMRTPESDNEEWNEKTPDLWLESLVEHAGYVMDLHKNKGQGFQNVQNHPYHQYTSHCFNAIKKFLQTTLSPTDPDLTIDVPPFLSSFENIVISAIKKKTCEKDCYSWMEQIIPLLTEAQKTKAAQEMINSAQYILQNLEMIVSTSTPPTHQVLVAAWNQSLARHAPKMQTLLSHDQLQHHIQPVPSRPKPPQKM